MGNHGEGKRGEGPAETHTPDENSHEHTRACQHGSGNRKAMGHHGLRLHGTPRKRPHLELYFVSPTPLCNAHDIVQYVQPARCSLSCQATKYTPSKSPAPPTTQAPVREKIWPWVTTAARRNKRQTTRKYTRQNKPWGTTVELTTGEAHNAPKHRTMAHHGHNESRVTNWQDEKSNDGVHATQQTLFSCESILQQGCQGHHVTRLLLLLLPCCRQNFRICTSACATRSIPTGTETRLEASDKNKHSHYTSPISCEVCTHRSTNLLLLLL